MDVHVPAEITSGLRLRGIGVITSQEDGTRESDDESLLARATELERMLFTEDTDFLRIGAWQASGRDFYGIGFTSQAGRNIGRLIDDLAYFTECAEEPEYRNRVVHFPL